MKKKLLMILLSAAMVISMLPATAFAGEAFYGTTNAAMTSSEAAAFAVTGTSGDKTVALSWNTVENAKKYKVYYAKSGAKKYKLAATTAKKTFTVKKLAKNTYYKFYVAAVNKKGKAIDKTAKLTIMTTGVPVKFNLANGLESTNIYDGKIPYERWSIATANKWAFTTTVDGKKVSYRIVKYNNERVGVETSDGQKLGLFYKDSPRYGRNLVLLDTYVVDGTTYTIGDIWGDPAPQKEANRINLIIDDEEDYYRWWGTKELTIDSSTWSEAIADGKTIEFEWELNWQYTGTEPDGTKEELSQLQGVAATTRKFECTISAEEYQGDWYLKIELEPTRDSLLSTLARVDRYTYLICYSNDINTAIGERENVTYYDTIENGHLYELKKLDKK